MAGRRVGMQACWRVGMQAGRQACRYADRQASIISVCRQAGV